MIGGLLQRAHCGTDRVLIHFGKDGSNGAARDAVPKIHRWNSSLVRYQRLDYHA
jgi:hypothetical protein